MASPLVTQRQSIGLKVESTAGTVETFDNTSQFPFPVKDIQPSPSIQQIVRDYYRDSGSPVPSQTGRKTGSYSFTSELRGSGSTGTEPGIATLFKAAGMSSTAVSVIPLTGAITGGPFQVGETVTGGTSTETATVAKTTYTGETLLIVYTSTVSGTFDGLGETLTGGTSSATVSSSGSEAAAGYVYRPQFTSYSNYSMAHQMGAQDTAGDDAVEVRLSGALATFELSAEVGGICEVRATVTGALENPQDVATFYESDPGAVLATAPQFFAADVLTGVNESTPIELNVNGISMSLGSNISVPTSSITATGNSPAVIGNFEGASGSIDPLLDLVATHDFFGNWYANETGIIQAWVGNVTANRFLIHAPNAQYTGGDPQDRDNLLASNVPLQLNGTSTGNDHLAIFAL